MPQISLTDFVDIVSKSGRPKATKVIQVKERPEYEPAFDFYKPLREHLIETHRTGQAKKNLDSVLTILTNKTKLTHFPQLIDGYKKWWGKKDLKWFTPPRDFYSSNGIDIIINPELGLEINGKRHIIKLYFKPEPLSSFRVEIISGLMEHQLRRHVANDDIFSVLDVRKSKLFTGERGVTDTIAIVNAEIAYIASLWK